MNESKEFPQRFDVIKCKDFAFGKREYNGKISVNSSKKNSFPVTEIRSLTDEELKEINEGFISNGNIVSGTVENKIDHGFYNEEWSSSEFLVKSAKWKGGSTGRDPFPDGWYVEAVRLDDNNNETKDTIMFYRSDTGCFRKEYCIDPENIILVRQK